jgi:transcription elongation GreA/GreB family factor
MPDIDAALIYETLKKIQADLSDLKRETREVKSEVISLRGMIGDLIKTDSRREAGHASLEQRVERIEARLDLRGSI